MLEIIGRLGPGLHELICHPGEERTPVLRPRGRAGRADVGEGAPGDRPARHLPLPLGGSILSGVREPDAPNEAAAPPEPYVPPQTSIAELTAKAVGLGIVFGVIFGAATVYLALKAGLTVSASIPIAVLAISRAQEARRRRRSWRTTSSRPSARRASRSPPASSSPCPASCSWPRRQPPAARRRRRRTSRYWTILTLALLGGVLGILMMIPLRRSLIVKEHAQPPLSRGDRLRVGADRRREGRQPRAHRLPGPGRRVRVRDPAARSFSVIAETPALALKQTNRFFPSATSSAARSRPSTWASATSSARASPACWWRAACWPGWG